MTMMAPTAVDLNMSHPVNSGACSVHSRNQSVVSDRPSATSFGTMSPPMSVSPEAAYVAASAASHIVTNDHFTRAETWYDQVGIEPSGQSALVGTGALQLANNFIDQLLFSILAAARSTTLSDLRPAVCEVLKPKLARDTMAQADEELREYLGGGEVDSLDRPSSNDTACRNWDLELVWKRTRLRCMVYSSLGDMEEDDEDFHLEQDYLRDAEDNDPDKLSPAVAIFLTSILEHVAEQVLVVAGQATFNRLRVKYENELPDGASSAGAVAERLIVEDLDMERVALDRTLGRLWRSWKKRIRSPTEPGSSPRSMDRSMRNSEGSCAGSMSGLHIPHGLFVDPLESTVVQDRQKQQVGSQPPADAVPASAKDTAERPATDLALRRDTKASDIPVEESAVMQRKRALSLTIVTKASYPLPQQRRRPYSSPVHKLSPLTRPERPQPSVVVDITNADNTDTEMAPAAATPVSGALGADSMSLSVPGSRSEDGVSPITDAGYYETAPYPVSPFTPPLTDPGAEIKVMCDALVNARGPEKREAAKKAIVGQVATVDKPPRAHSREELWQEAEQALVGVGELDGDQANDPNNEPEGDQEDEEDDDEQEEDAKILTSARVSLSAASVESDGTNGPLSVVPVSSNSEHYVRMIEVPVRSRNSSSDSSSSGRQSGEGSAPKAPTVQDSGDSRHISLDPKTASTAAVMLSAEDFQDAALSPRAIAAAMSSVRTRSPKSASSVSASSASFGQSRVNTVSTSSDSLRDNEYRMENYQRPLVQSRQPSLPTLPEDLGPTVGLSYSDQSRSGSCYSSDSPRRGLGASDSPSSVSSNKIKPVRTSDESNFDRSGDLALEFEALLQTDKTIQYTLTPEGMRDMDVSAGSARPAAGVLTHRQSFQSAHDRRPVGSSSRIFDSSHSSLQRTVSVTKSTGLRSHPPTDILGTQASGVRKVRSGSVAREARVPAESISELADFIRTTGPSGELERMAPRRVAGHTGKGRYASGRVPAARSSEESIGPRPNRQPSLHARESAANTSTESTDLIDLTQKSPFPTSRNANNVGLFRDGPDWGQTHMSGALASRAAKGGNMDLGSSRESTTLTETSVPSSINSQSALLGQTKPPCPKAGSHEDGSSLASRKQRHVRDAYAEDFSDEDDDELFDMTPKPRRRQEESLADFLRSCSPPPEPSPAPFVATCAEPKKKASAPNLMTRWRRKEPVSGRSGAETVPLSGQTAAGREGCRPQIADKATCAMKSGVEAAGSGSISTRSGGRVAIKKFEPRDPQILSGARTTELADFLRESGPPPPLTPAHATFDPVGEEKSGGLSRMFERRKKPTGVLRAGGE